MLLSSALPTTTTFKCATRATLPTRLPILRARFSTRSVSPSGIKMLPHQQNGKKSKILVFGAGNFGSCLADHLGDSLHNVLMWSRSESLVKHFNQYHRNPEALQDHQFSESITAIGPEFPTAELVQNMDVLLFAIPTEGVRCVSSSLHNVLRAFNEMSGRRETLAALRSTLEGEHVVPLLIFVNKGIEIKTRALTLEIIADTCGAEIAKVATFIVSKIGAPTASTTVNHIRSLDRHSRKKVSSSRLL